MDREQVAAFEPDRAVRWIEEACDHLQGRGLATPGWAEEGDEFAFADGEAEFVDGHVGTKVLADAVKFEDGHWIGFPDAQNGRGRLARLRSPRPLCPASGKRSDDRLSVASFLQRSTSRFQRLVHSSRFSLMTVQSGV